MSYIHNVDNGNEIGSNNPLPVTGTLKTQALSGTVLTIPSASITSGTTGGNISVGIYKELAVDVNVSALTGTTPSYQIIIDRQGADGVWYPIYTGIAITAIGVQSVSIGVGASTNVSFGSTIRVRELVTGTTPNVTRSVSLVGK